MSHHEHDKDTVMVVSARNRKIGLWLLIAPWAGLILILTAWAIASFVISSSISATPSDVVASGSTTLSSGDVRQTVARIINVALGFFGIICVVGIIVGIPLGIIFLKKREPADHAKFDARSGHGDASVAPEEIKGWNWGAFGLPVLWGICYNVWIALLCFIPFVGIPVSIYLGIKGNELAWKRNKWISVEEFHKTQRKWLVWGVLGFILSVIVTLSRLSGIATEDTSQSTLTNTSTYQPTSNSLVDGFSNSAWQDYVSTDGNFKIKFPKTPTRKTETEKDVDGYDLTTLTYSSSDAGASYYVFVYKYADPRMDETGSEYDVAGGLEAMMNGMVNNSKNGRLISSRKTNFLNKDALQYEIEVDNERLDGILLMNENRIYNIMVDYFSAASQKPDLELFVNSFELR